MKTGFFRNGMVYKSGYSIVVVACLLLSIAVTPPLKTSVQGAEIAINRGRLQLFKDALYWMSFRRNGMLMSNESVEELFLETIKRKYSSSKMYRTFVIAFEKGVLPKLNQLSNYPCTNDYTLKYKDPWNSSVTWYYQKKFTFDTYWNMKTSEAKYCNYRIGLRCIKGPGGYDGYCVCPEGSLWEYHTNGTLPGDRREQCLIQKNQPCALMDLDHGTDPQHRILADQLPYMIFNLERPLSCKSGTQCRFHADDLTTPRCYPHKKAPFHPPPEVKETWAFKLGQKCTLGLYADSGMCEVNTGQYGSLPGLVCYNFGPHRGPKIKPEFTQNITGYCAHEYGLATGGTSANGQLNFHPFFGAFLRPNWMSTADKDLPTYYKRFLDEVHSPLYHGGRFSQREGEPCNYEVTKYLKDTFNWFKYLEGDEISPDSLENALDNTITWLENPNKKACRIYKQYIRSHADWDAIEYPALTCKKIPEVTRDSHDNDGVCEKVAYDETTGEFADKFQRFLDDTSRAQFGNQNEEQTYNDAILSAYPENENCTMPATLFGRSLLQRSGDTLENKECPSGTVCFYDYGDPGIYDPATGNCALRLEIQDLPTICHEIMEPISYSDCEAKKLQEMIEAEIVLGGVVGRRSTLGLDEECDFDLETDLRHWIWDHNSGANKYNILAGLKAQKQFCDATRLLQCSRERVCRCVANAELRWSTIDGIEVNSEHCYVTRGFCAGLDVTKLVALTASEKEAALEHYGTLPARDPCSDEGNICAFLNNRKNKCTNGKTLDADSDYDDVEDAGAGQLGDIHLLTGFSLVVNVFWTIVSSGSAGSRFSWCW